MADTDGSIAFPVWALATFRTTIFVMLVVFLFHRTGELHDRLQASSTAFGFTIFLILWTTTTIATRRQIRASPSSGEDDLESRIARTVIAGAWNGLFLLIPLIVQAIGRLIASAPGPGRLAPLLGLPLLVVFGSPFAFVIGGVVAFAFGAVEALLFGISERLSRWADGDAHGSDVPP